MKKYKIEDVKKATLEYFNNDSLATDVWIKKYALRDSADNLYELTPDDMHKRIAKELARIEKKYPNPLSEDEIYNLLKDFKYIVPQGRPMSGIGNNFQTQSISNCFVLGQKGDSYASILYTDQELVQIAKRGGGIGNDLSHIRPDQSPVNNAAITSTGIIPFMERYSNSIREVGQNNRRGANILTIMDNHYQIEDFISAKSDKTKITGSNISIKISDELIEAVKLNREFEVKFPINSDTPQFSKKVNAIDLWNKIIKQNIEDAEPGMLFWDTIQRESIPDCYKEEGFESISVNPCFSGNTLIDVRQNINIYKITIKELVERFKTGENFEILSYNIKTEIYEYKQLLNGLLTHKNAIVLKINTTQGELIVTPEHEIYIQSINGLIKIQAKDLKGQDSIKTNLKFDIPSYVKTIEYLNDTEDVYDITVEDNHNLFANNMLAKNCGEIILSEYDSCRLLVLNTINYVNNPFTENASFNFELYSEHAYIAQRLMDDIVDLEIEKVDAIISKIISDPEDIKIKQIELDLWKKINEVGKKGRRTGLGFTGLGDTIAMLNMNYGESDSINFIDKKQRILNKAAYCSSIDMAKERGAFPVFNYNKEKDNVYLKRVIENSPELKDDLIKYGRRNIALLTNSPTGSLSIVTQSSSGVEPIFMTHYKRRRKLLSGETKLDFIDKSGDKWQEYLVFHPMFKKYLEIKNINIDNISDNELNEIIEKSPYKYTSHNINPKNKIDVISTIQMYNCHAISNCVVGDTLIKTDNGLFYIDEITDWSNIKTDSFVINEKKIKVQNFENEMVDITSYYNNGIKPVFEIKLANNMLLECTGNEKLFVYNNLTDICEWKNISDIEEGDIIRIKK